MKFDIQFLGLNQEVCEMASMSSVFNLDPIRAIQNLHITLIQPIIEN
jgi:hypothetical protein